MDADKALSVLSLLANGIDPSTGAILDLEGPYQTPEVIRALYVGVHAVEALLPKTKRVKKSAPRAGVPWTDAEDQQLLAQFDEGLDLSAMAQRLGRTVAGIQARLERHERLPTDTRRWRPGINLTSSGAPLSPPEHNSTPTSSR